MVNLGILGAGNIAQTHARAYAQLANARVVAVDDIVASKATALAELLHARAYTDWAAFLADPELEAVDVCLPTYLHHAGVIAAAQAGKHVLCEKPLALSLEHAEQMIAAVGKAGVKAMIAQVIRFWPHYLKIRDLMQRAELGVPIMAHAERLGSVPGWSSWYADPALSGGALFDLHIHDLDWMYYLFGKPATVYAIGAQAESGAWNHVLTTLDWDGMRATVEASLMMPAGFPFTMDFRVLGSKGYAEYRYGGTQRETQGGARHTLLTCLEGQPVQYPPCADEDPYLAEIRYFVDCLDAGAAPTIATLTEGLSVLEMTMAVRRSLETGAVVSLRREAASH